MARHKGKPAYPNKTQAGSYFITTTAFMLARAASKRTGKSVSDVIEHCLRETAKSITPATPGFEPPQKEEKVA